MSDDTAAFLLYLRRPVWLHHRCPFQSVPGELKACFLSVPGTGKSQSTDITGRVPSEDQVDLLAT